MKKMLRNPLALAALALLAVGLIVGGTVNGIAAAPRFQSGDWRAQVQLTNISVVLTENGEIRRGDDALVQDLLTRAGDASLKIGKTYDEKLAVRNAFDAETSTKTDKGIDESDLIDEYVRVTVYRYWVDAEGKKVTTLDPDLIKLHFLEGPQEGTDGGYWTIDKDASTRERTVLYYSGILKPGQDSNPFADTLTIDSQVIKQVTKLADGTDSFDYEGYSFRIEATADAVQTHSADEAMTSAWGRTNAK